MLLFTFLVLLGTTLAADPAHLTPGALSAHFERTFLVEDFLWIKYPFPIVVEVLANLRIVTEQLNAALSQFENNFPEEVGTSALLNARVTYINETLTLALDNYDGINLANRAKRSPIDGIGQISRMLFGTAMNEDVVKLREKLNQLTSFASAQNKQFT